MEQKVAYAVYDDQNTGINYTLFNTEERKRLPIYLNRDKVYFYCTCKPGGMCRMRMGKDGRIYNDRTRFVEHAKDCKRNTSDVVNVRYNRDFNPDQDSVEFACLSMMGLYKKETEEIRKKGRSGTSTEIFRKYGFICSILVNEYNKIARAHLPTSTEVRLNLFLKLKKLEITDADTKEDISDRLDFYVGRYSGCEELEGGKQVKLTMDYKSRRFYQLVDKDRFRNEEKTYCKQYRKKGLDPKEEIVLVAIVDKKTKRNLITFFPITEHGLIYDSGLEADFYRRIEAWLLKNTDYIFTKEMYNNCYSLQRETRGFISDGELYIRGKEERKIIVEIFGMMDIYVYSNEARLKKRFFEDREENYYLLDIYRGDSKETVAEKFRSALIWLKTGVRKNDTIQI